ELIDAQAGKRGNTGGIGGSRKCARQRPGRRVVLNGQRNTRAGNSCFKVIERFNPNSWVYDPSTNRVARLRYKVQERNCAGYLDAKLSEGSVARRVGNMNRKVECSYFKGKSADQTLPSCGIAA